MNLNSSFLLRSDIYDSRRPMGRDDPSSRRRKSCHFFKNYDAPSLPFPTVSYKQLAQNETMDKSVLAKVVQLSSNKNDTMQEGAAAAKNAKLPVHHPKQLYEGTESDSETTTTAVTTSSSTKAFNATAKRKGPSFGPNARPWRRMVLVIPFQTPPTRSFLLDKFVPFHFDNTSHSSNNNKNDDQSPLVSYAVDNPSAMSSCLANRLAQKIFAVFLVRRSRVQSTVLTNEHETNKNRYSDSYSCCYQQKGQAGILLQSAQDQQQRMLNANKKKKAQRQTDQHHHQYSTHPVKTNLLDWETSSFPKMLSSTTFVGAIVTACPNLLPSSQQSKEKNVIESSVFLIRPGSRKMFAFPDAPPPVQNGRTNRWFKMGHSDVLRHKDIAYSELKTFAAAPKATKDFVIAEEDPVFRPFVPVRSDFRYAVGQCVGIAVFRCKFMQTSAKQKHQTLRDKSNHDRNRFTESNSAVCERNVNVMGDDERDGNGDVVAIYTGKITYVGDRYIEYDVKVCREGSVGAIVFLLDQRQPRPSVKAHDFGRAIGVHMGVTIGANYGMKLHQ